MQNRLVTHDQNVLLRSTNVKSNQQWTCFTYDRDSFGAYKTRDRLTINVRYKKLREAHINLNLSITKQWSIVEYFDVQFNPFPTRNPPNQFESFTTIVIVGIWWKSKKGFALTWK